MPTPTHIERVYLHICTLRRAAVATFSASTSRYPFPIDEILRLVVSDRLKLAGDHLTAGDSLVLASHFRSAISRYYYAMYHAGRAIVFATEHGDDYERHSEMPRHLPPGLSDRSHWEAALTDARLLRNQADYDPYPALGEEWGSDARALSISAAQFLSVCEGFALTNGHV